MKPSDEQIAEWAEEWEQQLRDWVKAGNKSWRWFGRKNAYIAHKAYAAGRESMREEAEMVCSDADKSTHPSDLADIIRNLPISEGKKP